jgi:ElaB/YqjD/DUF883 family membrane-anchored ribosome-binding protein
MSAMNMSGAGEASTKDPEQIRAEIEVTREELAETVEALAAKADVKARLKEKQHEVADKIGEFRQAVTSHTPETGRSTLQSTAERVRIHPLPAVFLAGVLFGWLIARRK